MDEEGTDSLHGQRSSHSFVVCLFLEFTRFFSRVECFVESLERDA